MLNRGEIWLANLNPQRGTEPGKTRPVLIVQTQDLLEAAHPSTLIVPLTTNLIDDADPLRLRIPARDRLHHDSDLLFDQTRAIDNQRLVDGPLTQCPKTLMEEVDRCLLEMFGLTRFG